MKIRLKYWICWKIWDPFSICSFAIRQSSSITHKIDLKVKSIKRKYFFDQRMDNLNFLKYSHVGILQNLVKLIDNPLTEDFILSLKIHRKPIEKKTAIFNTKTFARFDLIWTAEQKVFIRFATKYKFYSLNLTFLSFQIQHCRN